MMRPRRKSSTRKSKQPFRVTLQRCLTLRVGLSRERQMGATRDKAVSYRAVWLIDGPAAATLEEYLQHAHRKLKTVASRCTGS